METSIVVEEMTYLLYGPPYPVGPDLKRAKEAPNPNPKSKAPGPFSARFTSLRSSPVRREGVPTPYSVHPSLMVFTQ